MLSVLIQLGDDVDLDKDVEEVASHRRPHGEGFVEELPVDLVERPEIFRDLLKVGRHLHHVVHGGACGLQDGLHVLQGLPCLFGNTLGLRSRFGIEGPLPRHVYPLSADEPLGIGSHRIRRLVCPDNFFHVLFLLFDYLRCSSAHQSYRWHAAKWPSFRSTRPGTSRLQRSITLKHLGWNGHPCGGLRGLGTSPFNMISRSFSPAPGQARRKAGPGYRDAGGRRKEHPSGPSRQCARGT